ncbi:major surface trophozoite antigen 11-like [Haliotis rubra]|uniref:major surface trophozoite antigen 11-like n=1 Tax=Haliotis rubra TaxID=36100 RepID=UPI001EE58003|nr:major surface trophozoite antigen 11-like [Haliotis rubra]
MPDVLIYNVYGKFGGKQFGQEKTITWLCVLLEMFLDIQCIVFLLSPVVCPTGEFRNAANTCESCPAGRYQPDQGATECTPCPAGQYQEVPGSVECKQCPSGTYQDATGASGCTDCPAGQYQDSTAAATCLDCPAGTSQAVAGGIGCEACPLATYQDTLGSPGCVNCQEGYNTTSTGTTAAADCLIVCVAGQFRTSSTVCEQCPEGTYQNETGSTQCLACPIGTYQPNTGSADCIACNTGYTTKYTRTIAESDCLVVCTPGEVRSASNVCQKCTAGTYQSNSGQETCTNCSVGTYQPASGATSCVSCDEGYTTSSTGTGLANECLIVCKAGQYRSARDTCLDCEYGQYQPDTGAEACLSCPSKLTTSSRGSTSAKDCIDPEAGGSEANTALTTGITAASSIAGIIALLFFVAVFFILCRRRRRGQRSRSNSTTSTDTLKIPRPFVSYGPFMNSEILADTQYEFNNYSYRSKSHA